MGRDANAELLKSSLSEAGVKLDHLREVDGPSGTAVILVQPSGIHSLVQGLHVSQSCPAPNSEDYTGRPTFIFMLTCMCAGENSIIIVGGANTADWELDEGALQVCFRCHVLWQFV